VFALEGRGNARRPVRRVPEGVATTVALALLLISMAPVSEASLAANVHRPFTGAVAFASATTYLAPGCPAHETGTPAVAPFANISTGRVGSVTHVNVTGGCSVAVANISTVAGFLGPTFHVTASSTRDVVFHWRIALRAAGMMTGAITGDAVRVTLFGNLFDNTTGSWVLPKDAVTVVFSFCCHFVGGISLRNYTVTVHAGLAAGDQYLFYTGVHTFVSSRCQTSTAAICGPKAHAAAHLDLALHGHGAWLVSAKII
jgi:hypothetical protein